MKKPALLFLLNFILINLSAQTCACKTVLNSFINKTEKNYAGFFDKVNDVNKKKYAKLKSSLLYKSKKINSNCFDLLYTYTQFFQDPHMILIENNNPPQRESVISLSEKPDKIAGIWYSRESDKIIFIKKAGEVYTGYLINDTIGKSTTGKILFAMKKSSENLFEAEVYNEYNQKRRHKCLVAQSNLTIVFFETFARSRLLPISQIDFSYKSLSDSVSILQFPSFSPIYKPVCDSIVNVNRVQIEQRKYLIVDIRNNSGGTILSFDKLFDYIYTNPTLYVSGINRVSEDNINGAFANLERYKSYFDSTQYSNEYNYLTKLKKATTHFVSEKQDTLIRTKAHQYPRKVIFLVNENTASAAEMLILMALQNKKTIVAGTNTNGAVDYTEPLFHFACDNKFVLGVPWIKRSRKIYKRNIDNSGIAPSINLSHLPEELWIKHVIQTYLN